MKYLSMILFLLFWNLSNAWSAVVTQPVEYEHGETVLEGFLAYDDAATEKRPGVIVVHEWKGLNDYAKGRATQLAELGYVALAVDMYGQGVRPESHEDAGKLAGMYLNDRNLMRSRAEAGLNVLKNHERVDASRLAAIGYCFGGATVLEMARAGMDLKGVVSFHGALKTPTPAEPGKVKAKIQVMHGGQDPHVGWDQVTEFQEEMAAANANWELTVFGDAVHSFTVPTAGNDPSAGAAYNEDADKRSWELTQEFLQEIFESA